MQTIKFLWTLLIVSLFLVFSQVELKADKCEPWRSAVCRQLIENASIGYAVGLMYCKVRAHTNPRTGRTISVCSFVQSSGPFTPIGQPQFRMDADWSSCPGWNHSRQWRDTLRELKCSADPSSRAVSSSQKGKKKGEPITKK